jgi:hypothetical protein
MIWYLRGRLQFQHGGERRAYSGSNGVITIKPESEIAKPRQLLANIHDAEHVTRHRAFEDGSSTRSTSRLRIEVAAPLANTC